MSERDDNAAILKDWRKAAEECLCELKLTRAERDALKARIAELEKDKARLDWMESQGGGWPWRKTIDHGMGNAAAMERKES